MSSKAFILFDPNENSAQAQYTTFKDQIQLKYPKSS